MTPLERAELNSRLEHIVSAATSISSICSGLTFAEYIAHPMAKPAVERHLTIIGEALRKLLEQDPSLATHISSTSAIVALRNRLMHDYPRIDDRLIWTIVHDDVPILLREVRALLAESP